MVTAEELERRRVSAERSKACEANVTVDTEHDMRRVWVWFPQLGGYSGHAEVQLYKPSVCEPGIEHSCFELDLYHDGEWPTDEVKHQWHVCSALQWVGFGLTVFEKQVEYYLDVVNKAGRLNDVEAAQLKYYRDRIDELLAKHAPPTKSTP